MLAQNRLLLGAALAFAACFTTAANAAVVGFDASRGARVTADQFAQRELIMKRPAAAGAKSANGVASATPALPRINTLAAYPPSCLADPLPDLASGPTYSRNVTLAAYNRNTQQVDSTEIVTITIWRVACSSVEFYNSATLMRIKRNTTSQVVYPLFPSIRISQGSIGFGDADWPANIARVATEPNTYLSDTLVDSPVLYDTTYVLEVYDNTQASVFDFNLPFSMRFDNLFASNNQFFIDVPLYNPNSGTYPEAFMNLPISGYFGTSWYTPNSGEGIVMQVYEPLGQSDSLIVSFTWSTYAPNGNPVFLVGNVTVPRGTRVATAPMYYTTGGSLGGNGPIDPLHSWGTTTVSFPDCNNMTLSYASNPGLPSFIPQGSGSRDWIRLGRLNGLNCE